MDQWRRGPILGHGSSATVSLATASPTGELFAVKSAVLSKSDLLQNEQRILASINCPQIVSYLGFELTSLHFNLFIEYAPGGSLSDLLKNHGGRLDEPAAQSHTYDLLTCLSYLHYRGIVHCDIKPDNILIGSDGRTKIADLGCARWMNEASYQVKGTPMFMAPEVARGEEQGPAADVWALGCTVLQMLTGSSPWTESDPVLTLHNISFSSAVPQIPSWVSDMGKDFLTKCLARDLKQRWTVDQLLKHPFAKLLPPKDQQDLSWDLITPKSMLDRDIWEIFSDKEEQDEEQYDEQDEEQYGDSNERVRELEGSCSDGPTWTWGESWIPIRSKIEDCSMTSMAVAAEEEVVLPSQISSIRFHSRQDLGSFSYERSDYFPIDDDPIEILECSNGSEMQQLCSCKTDLISFSNKSNDSVGIMLALPERLLHPVLSMSVSSLCPLLTISKVKSGFSFYRNSEVREENKKTTLYSLCLSLKKTLKSIRVPLNLQRSGARWAVVPSRCAFELDSPRFAEYFDKVGDQRVDSVLNINR